MRPSHKLALSGAATMICRGQAIVIVLLLAYADPRHDVGAIAALESMLLTHRQAARSARASDNLKRLTRRSPAIRIVWQKPGADARPMSCRSGAWPRGSSGGRASSDGRLPASSGVRRVSAERGYPSRGGLGVE